MRYTDDKESAGIAALIKPEQNAGPMLSSLSKYRTPSADKFFRDILAVQRNRAALMPFLMASRNDTVSDIFAEQLETALDELLEKTSADMVTCVRMWLMLQQTAFKQSSKMLCQLRRIAQNYKKLRRMSIYCDADGEKYIPGSVGDFLVRRMKAETERGITGMFLERLNEIIITGIEDSQRLFGESSSFEEDVRNIIEMYPDSFPGVRIWLHLTRDPENAYDLVMNDRSITEQDIMAVLGWLYYGKGYYLRSPEVLTETDNSPVSYNVPIVPDKRWINYLTSRPFEILEKYPVADPYYPQSVFEKYSLCVYHIISDKNEDDQQLCDYFVRSCVTGGTHTDFLGLGVTGYVDSEEKYLRLYEEITDRIEQGRQEFVYYMLEKAMTENYGRCIPFTTDIMKRCRAAVTQRVKALELTDVMARRRDLMLGEWNGTGRSR